MEKKLLIPAFTIFFILFSIPFAEAATEQIFFEDFDGSLTGWNESLCNLSDPPNQACSIGQSNLPNPNSPPFWGFVQVFSDHSPNPGPVQVRYEKTFEVLNEDDYIVSAWLETQDCSGCTIRTRLYIDGNLIFQESGVNLNQNQGAATSNTNATSTAEIASSSEIFPPTVKTFRATVLHLTPGIHNVEIGMFSNIAENGNFRAYFDDITVSRTIPLDCGPKTIAINDECIPDLTQICGQGTIPDFDVLMCFGLTMNAVGGQLLEINSISLLVGAIGTNPVITALIGITLAGVAAQAVWFMHKRKKSENS